MIKNWFKKKLNVPENWDKYDYEQQRYSFNDMVDFAEQYHTEQCAMNDVIASKQIVKCVDCSREIKTYKDICAPCRIADALLD